MQALTHLLLFNGMIYFVRGFTFLIRTGTHQAGKRLRSTPDVGDVEEQSHNKYFSRSVVLEKALKLLRKQTIENEVKYNLSIQRLSDQIRIDEEEFKALKSNILGATDQIKHLKFTIAQLEDSKEKRSQKFLTERNARMTIECRMEAIIHENNILKEKMMTMNNENILLKKELSLAQASVEKYVDRSILLENALNSEREAFRQNRRETHNTDSEKDYPTNLSGNIVKSDSIVDEQVVTVLRHIADENEPARGEEDFTVENNISSSNSLCISDSHRVPGSEIFGVVSHACMATGDQSVNKRSDAETVTHALAVVPGLAGIKESLPLSSPSSPAQAVSLHVDISHIGSSKNRSSDNEVISPTIILDSLGIQHSSALTVLGSLEVHSGEAITVSPVNRSVALSLTPAVVGFDISGAVKAVVSEILEPFSLQIIEQAGLLEEYRARLVKLEEELRSSQSYFVSSVQPEFSKERISDAKRNFRGLELILLYVVEFFGHLKNTLIERGSSTSLSVSEVEKFLHIMEIQ